MYVPDRGPLSHFRQYPAPPATKWFDSPKMYSGPGVLKLFHCLQLLLLLLLPLLLLPLLTPPLPVLRRESSAAFQITSLSRKIATSCSTAAGSIIFKQQLAVTPMSTTSSTFWPIHAKYFQGSCPLGGTKKFVYSVLGQTVLNPDGILIIPVHSDTGDASAVYADLVN